MISHGMAFQGEVLPAHESGLSDNVVFLHIRLMVIVYIVGDRAPRRVGGLEW